MTPRCVPRFVCRIVVHRGLEFLDRDRLRPDRRRLLQEDAVTDLRRTRLRSAIAVAEADLRSGALQRK